MAVKDIMELLDEHPELVDEALEILREYKKNPSILHPAGCMKKPSTPGPEK